MTFNKKHVLLEELNVLERIDQAIEAVQGRDEREVPPHLLAEREAAQQRIQRIRESGAPNQGPQDRCMSDDSPQTLIIDQEPRADENRGASYETSLSLLSALE